MELIEQPFTVITCSSILLVNLERIGFNLRNFDMTIVFKVRPAEAPETFCLTVRLLDQCKWSPLNPASSALQLHQSPVSQTAFVKPSVHQ